MGYALPVTVQMTDMQCGECGIQFAVPEGWRAEKQRTGGGWYCPNGHFRVYRESDADRYKRLWSAEEARHKATLARCNEATAALAESKAELRRHKTRVNNGVCPCCNRTFVNLQRHMKTKHPDIK